MVAAGWWGPKLKKHRPSPCPAWGWISRRLVSGNKRKQGNTQHSKQYAVSGCAKAALPT